MILLLKERGRYNQSEISDLDSIVLSHVDVLVTGAHQDDEAFAYPFVGRMYGIDAKVGTVIATDGAGSNSRGVSDLVKVRNTESVNAGREFGLEFLLLMNYSSSDVKSGSEEFKREIRRVLEDTAPRIIFTHSPYDQHDPRISHDTHIKVAEAVVETTRELQLVNVLGYPIWGSLIEWGNALSERIELHFTKEEVERWTKFMRRHFQSQIKSNPYDEALIARTRFQNIMRDAHKPSIGGYTEFLMDYSTFTRGRFNGTFEEYIRVLRDASFADMMATMNYSERLAFVHKYVLPKIRATKDEISGYY